MKIKTFTFLISSPSGTADFGPSGSLKDYYDPTKMHGSAEIDETINKFISKVDVVSISVNHPMIKHHNNGGHDTIMAIYTILYNEKKEK